MGEYAKYNGERIKIGTCEDMYYLRADQAHLVQAEPGNVDPIADREHIRFRFPFPQEDGIKPGEFQDAFYALTAPGLAMPEDVEHHTIQFSAKNGYLMSVPCPEGPEFESGQTKYGGTCKTHKASGLTVGLNGYGGAVKIAQQRWVDGKLVLICQCGGCGAAYRLSTLEEAQPVIDSLEKQAAADKEDARSKFWQIIADRIRAGYLMDETETAPESETAQLSLV